MAFISSDELGFPRDRQGNVVVLPNEIGPAPTPAVTHYNYREIKGTPRNEATGFLIKSLPVPFCFGVSAGLIGSYAHSAPYISSIALMYMFTVAGIVFAALWLFDKIATEEGRKLIRDLYIIGLSKREEVRRERHLHSSTDTRRKQVQGSIVNPFSNPNGR